MAIELSDKLLMDAGGWKEMKEARQIHKAGKVSEASYSDGWLEGLVFASGKQLKVRMQIMSRIDMENHCSCFMARRDGAICAHAMALGLEVLTPTEKKIEKPAAATVSKKEASKPISKDWPKLVDQGDSKAVPAKVHLVFSPNIEKAWQQNSLLVGVELESSGERKMLAASKGKSLFVEARDTAIFKYLQTLTPEKVPVSLQLNGEDFLGLLGNLAGHPRITLGKKASVEVSYLPLRPELKLSGDKIQVVWPEATVPLISIGRIWVFDQQANRLQPVAPGLPIDLYSVFDKGYKLQAAWLAVNAARLSEWFELDQQLLDDLPKVISPEFALELEGSVNHQEAKLYFVYGDETVPAAKRDAVYINGEISDVNAELGAIDRLESFGYDQKSTGVWVLKDNKAILRFLAHGYQQLVDLNWHITIGERFEHSLLKVDPIQATFDFQGSGEDWFALDLEFTTASGEGVSYSEIQRLLQMGQESQTMASGKIAVLDTELLETIQSTIADVDPGQDTPGVYTVDRSHAGYLRETAEASGIVLKGSSPWEAPFEFEPVTSELAEILRPYQAAGVEWMLNLAGQSLGGILADDMGLGKTLQTLATIHTIGGSTLVVCPSSLVSNWVAEAEKFVPDLKTVALEGPKRDQVYDENVDANLFVTSYALLRLDSDKWKQRGRFTTVILDEAQQIKNPKAKVTKAAHRLEADYRFALTGTPVENSVRDLWSISHFVMPNYLGNQALFSERFEKPIGKGDESAKQRLSRRLKPLILRRLKSEVAQDLPEKIEQVVYCDLKPKQQAVYEQILRESQKSILDADGNRKRMMALTALLRLRQTCCDLRLLGMQEGIEEKDCSVKVEALEELVTQAVEGGHKILVFSQFVEMLQVLVPMLSNMGHKFCYLDGSTKNRGKVVQQFQDDPEIPVFLISLKAGGVGLNLTAADTVIHVDPWWNPAVEAQATDRAHRIGQTRVVTSYKLITRNTVEEKILALQNKKKETIASIVDGQVDLGETGLAEDELMELFE